MSVILNWLVDFVYPKTCVICGKEGVFLCSLCLKSLGKAEQTCPGCGRASVNGFTHARCIKPLGLDGLTATYSYRDPKVRKVVETIKFGFNRDLMEQLLQGQSLKWEADLVVPIPLHRLRLNWRGFNQAEEIAKCVGQPPRLSNLLVRIKNTKQQARIKDKKERKENVKGAFAINTPLWSEITSPPAVAGPPLLPRGHTRGKLQERVKEYKVLLVDDVFTTGESMKECCKVLKRAGVKQVWGLVLAR